MIRRSASGSRWASSSVARRSNRSVTRLRSSGVIWSSPSSHDDGSHVGSADGRGMTGGAKYFALAFFPVATVGYAKVTAWLASTAGKLSPAKNAYSCSRKRGERIDAFQLRVDEARMAHDHAAARQPRQEAREQRREVRPLGKIVGARKARIGEQPERRRRGGGSGTLSTSSRSPLRSAKRSRSGSARPHWRSQAVGAPSFTTSSSASLTCGNRCTCWWPSTKSGARPNASTNARSWPLISAASAAGCQPAQAAVEQHRSQRRESALAQRREALAQRPERRGQRQVQSDRHERGARREHLERHRFRAVERRRRRHHRGGVEPSAHDQVADRHIDRGRDAVIVGAQPDAALRGCFGRRSVRTAVLLGRHDQSSCFVTPWR